MRVWMGAAWVMAGLSSGIAADLSFGFGGLRSFHCKAEKVKSILVLLLLCFALCRFPSVFANLRSGRILSNRMCLAFVNVVESEL